MYKRQSLGILNSEALFKQDKSASKHDVNVNYHKYNFRTNIDADLTKTTLLSLNLEAVIKTQNAPGTGSSNKYLWESQANLPPTVVPVKMCIRDRDILDGYVSTVAGQVDVASQIDGTPLEEMCIRDRDIRGTTVFFLIKWKYLLRRPIS